MFAASDAYPSFLAPITKFSPFVINPQKVFFLYDDMEALCNQIKNNKSMIDMIAVKLALIGLEIMSVERVSMGFLFGLDHHGLSLGSNLLLRRAEIEQYIS
jgi:hypothetical protein